MTIFILSYVGCMVSSEFGRAMIGSTIFALDLLIVAQEWDFPNFDTGIGVDVKIVGLEVSSIDFSPEWLSEYFHFEITGTWMNYTPMFLTMGLGSSFYFSSKHAKLSTSLLQYISLIQGYFF